MDIQDLIRVKEMKINEIEEMKKPKKPRYLETTKGFWIILLISIPFLIISTLVLSRSYDSKERVQSTLGLIMSIPLTVLGLYGVSFFYISELNKHRDIISHWKRHKRELIEEIEDDFEEYEKQLLTKGTIQTNDPYLKQALGLMPKCPTCGSTNLKSVSGVKRDLAQTAFGIANPTARAQFQCKNCGYKW